ncbi:ankyrin repeat domain-containing protein [Wolbachia endosymbiont (group A) of Epistrophe grossularia]|uniref:ankyrin repeat domain-containing protein n=1 Tax=Wolbachia endosymbiont (group A) of Epistrophe grossularia TaxID=2954008 RepID=UPI002231E367|nr:ankyrin repeat domain-containing protein [Wolbachia endosymbiont (group A) of Epistrophe grossularia]
MEMKREKFFEIIQEVSESRDLSSDNVLKKVQDKLKEKSDENGIDSPYTIVYNIFKSNDFYKNHEFKLQMPDGTTARGTLLHFAVQCGDALMVKLLLENKVSVTMKDHSGLTPLDIATSNSDQEIVHLLDAKANSKLEKNKDKTPRDIIIKTNKTPEGLVVNGNNAAAAPANVISPYLKQHDATRNDKQTSVTGESSDSTADEQCLRVSVKNMVEKIESSKKTNATYSDKRILTDESDSEDSGLELGLETASNTSSRSEINHDGANHVEENVDNQTLENALRSQKEENQSLKQQIQDLESKNATLKGELEKTKKNEVPLEKAQKELTELRSYITGHETKLEALEKLNEENEPLEQKIQDLESKNTTLNSELEENENKHSKTKVLLEKAQKELAESKSCIVGHETKLKQFNKENESLTQKIKSLENENTTLKGELGKTKTKTNEVSLEKAGKRQMSFLKVASVNLVTMLTVGATLSIAFDLSVLPIIVVFVTSAALLASCVTYAISKPIAEPKPTTELKEVDIQGSAQRCL